MSPFQALYGYTPPTGFSSNLSTSLHDTVKEWKIEREQILQLLKEKLQQAQNRMKQNADKKRVDKEYKVGDMVYLKLQPYRQNSVVNRRCQKLTSRYFGPYEVVERIGPVAYRLKLPEESKIHPVFHVSQLKSGVKELSKLSPSAPTVGQEGQLLAQPEQILNRRMLPKGNRAVTQVLVKWSNMGVEDATWEDYWKLKERFPDFDP